MVPAALCAAAVLVPGTLAACSGGSASPTPSSSAVPGIPGDTASPLASASLTPTPTGGPPTVSGGATASPETTPADLAGCLAGTWQAPVQREFTALGLQKASNGVVRGGTGTLRLTFTAARTYSLSYEQVKLSLALGSADVTGGVDGTWSLTGSTLHTTVTKNSTSVKASVAGVPVDSGALSGALGTVPPSEVFTTCTSAHLRLAPTGTGTTTQEVTFDRA